MKKFFLFYVGFGLLPLWVGIISAFISRNTASPWYIIIGILWCGITLPIANIANIIYYLRPGSELKIFKGEFFWSARSEIPVTPDAGPSVWVADAVDYDRGIENMNNLHTEGKNDNLELIEWKCNKCGENNEGQFSECWQCGNSRPLSL